MNGKHVFLSVNILVRTCKQSRPGARHDGVWSGGTAARVLNCGAG